MNRNQKKKSRSKEFGLQDTVLNKGLLALLVGLFAFVLYSNTLEHGYALDDLIATTDNRLVQKGADGLWDILTHGYFYGNTGRNDESYRPLSLLSLAIETDFAGNNAPLNHLFNVLYYALACSMVFLLLAKLFRHYSLDIALIAALLYAAHPVHTEVVANIKSRDEIFNLLFSAAAFLGFLQYAEQRRLLPLIWSLFAYFLALMSKEYGVSYIVVFPVLLWVLHAMPLRRIVASVWPYLAVVAFYFVLRLSVLDVVAFAKEINPFENSLMAAGSFAQQLATNMLIMGKYLKLLVLPHPLSWDYSINTIPLTTFADPVVWLVVLVHLALGGYMLWGIWKKQLPAIGILLYLASLSLTSNLFVKIAWTMGERFLFMPSLGLSIVLLPVALYLFKIGPRAAIRYKPAFYALFVVVVAAFSLKTYSRNPDWKNSLTLYQADISKYPESARMHLVLASSYIQLAKDQPQSPMYAQYVQKSYNSITRCLEIYPDNRQALSYLGYIHYVTNKFDKAKEAYQKALELDSVDISSLNYLGICESKLGNLQLAEQCFKRVAGLDSTYVMAYNNLVFVYQQLGQLADLLVAYQQLEKYEGPSLRVMVGLGSTYFRLGDYKNAVINLEKALGFAPTNKDVLTSLAKAKELLQQGR